jgi:hypothetical protein
MTSKLQTLMNDLAPMSGENVERLVETLRRIVDQDLRYLDSYVAGDCIRARDIEAARKLLAEIDNPPRVPHE